MPVQFASRFEIKRDAVQFKIAKNSLFAYLVRSPSWISFVIALVLATAGFYFLAVFFFKKIRAKNFFDELILIAVPVFNEERYVVPVMREIRKYARFGDFGIMKGKVTRQGELVAQAPVDGFEFHPGEYVSKSAFRDFFYLTRKSEVPISAAPCPSCPKSK